MPEKYISNIRVIIRLVGFDPLTGKWGIQVFIYILALTVLIINSILYVVYKWNDRSKGLEGVKGLVLYLMCVAHILGLTSHWDETIQLVKNIEDGLYKHSYRNTAKNSKLKCKVEMDMAKLRSIWNYMFTSYTIAACITPAMVFIFLLTKNSISNITVDMLHTMFPFYYPENYETITVYVMVYSLQCHFATSGIMKAYVVLVSAFNSMQMIAGELMILTQSIQEIDFIMEQNETIVHERDSINYCVKTTKCSTTNVRTLKSFLQYFMKHHYHIHRKVKNVTRGMQLIAFSVTSGVSLLLCTSLYTMAGTNDVFVILNEVIYSGVLTICLYCYGLMGEKISTEDEKLRAALYEYTWVDKPQWFKRSLLIILTRTTKTLEMKSSGLFALNLRNFLATLQAAYSYFNILSSLR